MKAEYLLDGSPDCPLVRLFAFSPDEAAHLQEACSALADGRLDRYDLTAQLWCQPVDGFLFHLVASDADFRLRPAGKHFEWAITQGTWRGVVDRIEPFTHVQPPGTYFQWLDEDAAYSSADPWGKKRHH